MGSINSKQKGKRIELEFSHKLKEFGATTARRTQQFCGKEGDSDVVAEELNNFHIEVKGVKNRKLTRSQISGWIRQTQTDCPEDKIPFVAVKANNAGWLIIIETVNLVKIYPKWMEITNVLAVVDPAFDFFKEAEKMRESQEMYKEAKVVLDPPGNIDYGFLYKTADNNLVHIIEIDNFIHHALLYKGTENVS